MLLLSAFSLIKMAEVETAVDKTDIKRRYAPIKNNVLRDITDEDVHWISSL